MTSKYLALAAAALFALAAPAFAEDTYGDSFPTAGRAQVFSYSVPRLDLGSEAYISTRGQGAGEQGMVRNRVTGNVITDALSYHRGFDTGSETYPTLR